MALVKIFSLQGVEIEYKKDSLSLKKENNSLSSDFKVPHSQFPFLVIENDVTKSVLGPSDITSIRKNKIVPVIILENGVRYYGELQQLTVLKKFRKCNLKYGSDIIPIVNKKISKFMPIVSVIPGETDPEPYSENSTDIVAGSEEWETFPVSMIGQIFPDVKFQFPTMYWNKFDNQNKDWTTFKNLINAFDEASDGSQTFLTNSYTISGVTVILDNSNIPSPQVFLLSPLFYVFDFLGWKILGNFTTNYFVRCLMMLSFKDNISETPITSDLQTIDMSAVSWTNWGYSGTLPHWGWKMREFSITLSSAGTYVFEYDITEPDYQLPPNNSYNSFDFPVVSRLQAITLDLSPSIQRAYTHKWNQGSKNYKGKFTIVVDAANVGTTLKIEYINRYTFMPAHDFKLYKTYDYLFMQQHPTIDLGRYVPDWTVGNYLNYIKNQFNLDITLDDFKKEATFNLNESLANSETPEILDKSLVLKSFELAANSSFVLKYQNDEDEALFITRDEVVLYDNQDDDFTKKIETKFKFVPRNGYTSELSEALEDKDGVGLMIYEPINAPYTSEATINGFNLSIPGEKGIYETFFRRWLKFLLNASNCEVTGYFTETEISKINKAKAVYINNQRFRIIDIQTTEAANNFQEVKMRLLSVNY